jgi:hypothetical protein
MIKAIFKQSLPIAMGIGIAAVSFSVLSAVVSQFRN